MDFRMLQEWADTPCLVVNTEQVRKNIAHMQAIADENGCSLRPHIKTHKSAAIAKWQIDAGACGITCAKLSEAEVMADGGLEDIFVAYPIVGEQKIRRAAQLQARLKRLILAVDSVEGAKRLSSAAGALGICFEVRLEIDTGAKRTGMQRENWEDWAQQILRLPNLDVTGIYTFKSLVFAQAPTTDSEKAGAEESQMMAEVAERLRRIGFAIRDISVGSSPTAESCAKSGLVTEIRPGTYVFYDAMNVWEKSCAWEDVAAFVLATVVSTPEKGYAVLDSGAKTFSGDVVLNQPPFYFRGYASVWGRDDLILDRMNEEHGIIRSVEGDTRLAVGDVVVLVPTHVCTALNLQNYFFAVSETGIEKMIVDARGMLV